MTHNPWHELLELIAAAVLTIGGAVALTVAWRRRQIAPAAPPAQPLRAGRRGAVSPWLALLAALSLGAGAIHLATTPSHLEELGVAGLGFLGVAVFQLAWPVTYALAPGRRAAAIGIAGNAAVLAAWAWSRTAGLPFGPSAGIPEAVGTADAAASVFEVALVALLLAQLAAQAGIAFRPLRRVTSAALVAVVPAVGVVFLTSTLAVSVALAGHSHAGGDAHGEGATLHGADHVSGTDAEPHGSDGEPGHGAGHDANDDHHDEVAPSPGREVKAAPTKRSRPPASLPPSPSRSPTATPDARADPTEAPASDDGTEHGHGEGEDAPHAHP